MVNIGPLAAKVRSGVWGTPSNFSGFRVLASLLQQRRLPEVHQTLPDVSFASKSCVLLYWQRYCTALQQWGQPNFVAWSKEWNFRRGRSSRWASAHILVVLDFQISLALWNGVAETVDIGSRIRQKLGRGLHLILGGRYELPYEIQYFRTRRVVWQRFPKIGPGTSKNFLWEKKQQ